MDRAMQEKPQPMHKRFVWGVTASVLLHGLLVLAFLAHWPASTPDAPKEEVVSVSIEPPPEEKPQPEKPKPEKQLQLELRPEAKPKEAPAPAAAAPKAEEKKPEEKQEAKPPAPAPSPEPPKPAEDKPQALESAPKDEEAPKEDAPPVPPPAEEPAAQTQSPPPDAPKAGPDKSAVGDPQKTEPPQPPALPKDVTLPDAGLAGQLPTPDKAEKPGGGLVTEQRFALDEESATQPQQKREASPSPASADKKAGPVAALKPVKRIYSKATLSDPRVRQALGTLPPERRIVQICSIEMLEQIRRAVPGAVPDVIAGSPTTRQTVTARLMDVSGAAFRSRGQWYDIGYHCETDAKTLVITSFSYSLGAAVPKSQWQARRFPVN
ncbi:DUF930 domain-containing protein [Agrobacterium vitis]|nr:DUF930 domain-containing protein [Agrobacterium vitis]